MAPSPGGGGRPATERAPKWLHQAEHGMAPHGRLLTARRFRADACASGLGAARMRLPPPGSSLPMPSRYRRTSPRPRRRAVRRGMPTELCPDCLGLRQGRRDGETGRRVPSHRVHEPWLAAGRAVSVAAAGLSFHLAAGAAREDAAMCASRSFGRRPPAPRRRFGGGRETGQSRVIDGAAFDPARSVPRGRDAAGRTCAKRLGPHRETWTGSSSAFDGTRSPGRRPRGAGGRRCSPARAGSRAAGAGAARASSPGSRHLVDGKSGGISCNSVRIVAGHGRRDAPGGWERGSGRRGGYGHRRRGGAARQGGLAAMVSVAPGGRAAGGAVTVNRSSWNIRQKIAHYER